MSTLSDKVSNFFYHPATSIVSGLYLTGVGLTAINHLNKNKDSQKNAAEKVIVVGWLTGFAAVATAILGSRFAYNSIKSH